MVIFIFKEEQIRFRLQDMCMPCGSILKEYLHFSLPVMVSDTILGLGNSAVMMVAGHIGRTFMTANTITMVIQQMATIFSSGLGQAALIITGNSLGEGKIEQTQKQSVSLVCVSFILGVTAAVIAFIISPVIVNFYHIRPETKEMTLSLMHAVTFVLIFMISGGVLTKGILRGGGDTTYLMVADVIFLWIVSVPLGAAAGLVWKWPPFWILFCLRSDYVIKTILCLFRLHSGKWIKKIKTDSGGKEYGE